MVTLILTLLIFGCPLLAVVMVFKIDERTLSDWLDKAGEHAVRVQDHLVCQGQLDLGQVKADERWCRSQRGVVWVDTAISVASRLLIWGSVASGRTEAMIAEVVQHVHRAARLQPPILRVRHLEGVNPPVLPKHRSERASSSSSGLTCISSRWSSGHTASGSSADWPSVICSRRFV